MNKTRIQPLECDFTEGINAKALAKQKKELFPDISDSCVCLKTPENGRGNSLIMKKAISIVGYQRPKCVVCLPF